MRVAGHGQQPRLCVPTRRPPIDHRCTRTLLLQPVDCWFQLWHVLPLQPRAEGSAELIVTNGQEVHPAGALHVEPDVDDVSVLDQVITTFHSQPALLSCCRK
jgi:hypothetical protein